MEPDGWNHNAHYHAGLLDAVPPACERALDVGCGLGAFTRRLATIVPHVDALDVDEAVLLESRRLSTGAPHIRFLAAEFMQWSPDEGYDFISMVAVLHHLPFHDALERASGFLRPGGVLAVLGLDRAESLLHAAARSSLAYPLSGYYRSTRRGSPVGAQTRAPMMTITEIRQQVSSILPGSRIRQHLLWRYSLIWTKPTARRPSEVTSRAASPSSWDEACRGTRTAPSA